MSEYKTFKLLTEEFVAIMHEHAVMKSTIHNHQTQERILLDQLRDCHVRIGQLEAQVKRTEEHIQEVGEYDEGGPDPH